MQIQLRSYEKDCLVVLRHHKEKKDQPLQVDLIFIMANTSELVTTEVQLRPGRDIDNLRIEIDGELRERRPRSELDVLELIQRIQKRKPFLFYQ